MTVPGAQPLIYIGENIFDPDLNASTPMYTLQDTVSFSRFGNFTEYHGPANLAEEGLMAYSSTPDQLRELMELPSVARASSGTQTR
jgi:hypothetical protein